MFPRDEPENVYKALVADLAYSTVPTSVMGATLVMIGGYVYAMNGQPGIAAAAILGGLSSAAKVIFLARHRRSNADRAKPLAQTRRQELVHAVLTAGMSLSVGAMSALIFAQPDKALHLVATALLFGYCSGVVCRLSVRPWLATGALLLCAAPSIVSILGHREVSYAIVGLLFLIFIIAGLETVEHVYRNARKHITMQLQMAELARLDGLTQLPNRLALQEAFELLPRRAGELIAIHAFDLDGFKAVNDRHGHRVGDQLLGMLAGRLTDLLGSSDVAARIGGDEFVVVQAGLNADEDARLLAMRIHETITEPYEIGERIVRIGLSLGYSVRPAEQATLATLLEPADQASYRAKRQGGGLEAACGEFSFS